MFGHSGQRTATAWPAKPGTHEVLPEVTAKHMTKSCLSWQVSPAFSGWGQAIARTAVSESTEGGRDIWATERTSHGRLSWKEQVGRPPKQPLSTAGVRRSRCVSAFRSSIPLDSFSHASSSEDPGTLTASKPPPSGSSETQRSHATSWARRQAANETGARKSSPTLRKTKQTYKSARR